MLSENTNNFLKLLREIKRPGVEELIKFLEESDFFSAPASIKLFKNHEGGLCDHAMIRYKYIKQLYSTTNIPIPSDSLIIVALLADINKINYFEPTIINKKIYSPDGDKHDTLGNYSWVQESGWKVKDPEDRFIFGTSGQNAERIITNYMPLRDDESAAIINLGVTYENPTFNTSNIYKKYPLACLLSVADQMATFLDEQLPF